MDRRRKRRKNRHDQPGRPRAPRRRRETRVSQTIKKSLEFLRGFGPKGLDSTYAISLQTMVYAAADPAKDIRRITDNVEWLEDAQIKLGDIAEVARNMELFRDEARQSGRQFKYAVRPSRIASRK